MRKDDIRDIFLLDLDSVLVRPLGYREALRATVNHFGLRMNQDQGALSPTDAEIETFEAHGFGSEWDSIPMCLAAFFTRASEWGTSVWRPSLTSTMVLMARSGYRFPRPDYTACVQQIAADQPDGDKLPALKALDYFLARTDRVKSAPVLRELLGDTANVRTPTTRTFQHFTLGSRRFVRIYGFGPDFGVESYLLTRDEPLLTQAGREMLTRAAAQSGVRYAIYTARPSHPPPGAIPFGYAPEAEMACRLVGLEKAPLVGFGHVSWLAQQTGAHPNAYTKPSPVQALAAISAAWSGAVDESLWAALALVEERQLTGPLAALTGAQVRITVFEDTPAGVQAVLNAAKALHAAGLDVSVRGVGIAEVPVKREALAPLTDWVVEDVDEGLRLALEYRGLRHG